LNNLLFLKVISVYSAATRNVIAFYETVNIQSNNFYDLAKSYVMPRCGTVTETILLSYLKVFSLVLASPRPDLSASSSALSRSSMKLSTGPTTS
jgi:hypothetical protein